jgi:hypothetical protein
MKSKIMVITSVIVVLLISSPLTVQAQKKPKGKLPSTTVGEAWDQQDFLSWFPMGGSTHIERVVYLEATGFFGKDSVGFFTTLPAFTGAYTQPGYISLKINVSVQQATDIKPVLLLQFSPSDKYWYFALPNFPAVGWQEVTVSFDPAWTDEQALAKGWKQQQEGVAVAKSWQETLSHVYRLGVLMDGPYRTVNYKCILQIAELKVTQFLKTQKGTTSEGGLGLAPLEKKSGL